jgi:hypothetical protein
MKNWGAAILALVVSSIAWGATGDCSGTPDDAVMELPRPLDMWGGIVCTPYGHIVAPAEGWIWSNPGALSPVMIPSQMVRSNPKTVGNEIYFSDISIVQLSGTEAEASIAAFLEGFDQSDPVPQVLEATFVSSTGKSLVLHFYPNESVDTGGWGAWCGSEGGCRTDTRFMILNMNKNPNQSNKTQPSAAGTH